MNKQNIPSEVLKRIPEYIMFLHELKRKNRCVISVKNISTNLNYPISQINEDFEFYSVSFSSSEIYDIRSLISSLENSAGLKQINEVFIVGTGNLLKEVLALDEFNRKIIKTLAIFSDDIMDTVKLTSIAGVLPIERVGEMCSRMKMRTCVLALDTEDSAEEVFMQMVNSGIRTIINFTSFKPEFSDVQIFDCADNRKEWLSQLIPTRSTLVETA